MMNEQNSVFSVPRACGPRSCLSSHCSPRLHREIEPSLPMAERFRIRQPPHLCVTCVTCVTRPPKKPEIQGKITITRCRCQSILSVTKRHYVSLIGTAEGIMGIRLVRHEEAACSAPSQANDSGNCYIENKCSSVLSVRADGKKHRYYGPN